MDTLQHEGEGLSSHDGRVDKLAYAVLEQLGASSLHIGDGARLAIEVLSSAENIPKGALADRGLENRWLASCAQSIIDNYSLSSSGPGQENLPSNLKGRQ